MTETAQINEEKILDDFFDEIKLLYNSLRECFWHRQKLLEGYYSISKLNKKFQEVGPEFFWSKNFDMVSKETTARIEAIISSVDDDIERALSMILVKALDRGKKKRNILLSALKDSFKNKKKLRIPIETILSEKRVKIPVD